MKKGLIKVIGTMLSALVIASTGLMVSGTDVAAASNKNRPIKILAIGNSYSNNATEYVSRIASSMGLNITAASLYQAGCPLRRHVAYYEAYRDLGKEDYYSSSNSNKYESLYINGVAQSGKASIQEAIAHTDWDYITIQQMPDFCDDITSYYTEQNPYITKLYGYVLDELKKNGNKKCEILIHQGWSFSHAMSIDRAYQYYPVDYENTKEFFAKIESTVNEAADILKTHAGLKKAPELVVSGKAVQLAKDEFGFGDTFGNPDSMYADYISHLSHNGRYLAACVWIETFAKKAGLATTDVRKATFIPMGTDVTPDRAAALRSCAHEAVTGEADTLYGDWRAVPQGDGVIVTNYNGKVPKGGKLTVPARLSGKKVYGVSENAFKYVEGITSVTVEEDKTPSEPSSSTPSSSLEPSSSESDKTPSSSVVSSSEQDTGLTIGETFENGSDGEKSGGFPWLFVLLGAVLLLAAASAVVFFVLKTKK